MSTNARQVDHSLQQKIDNIKEDNNAIAALCAEAAKTRDEVAGKLENFVKSAGKLSSMHMTALRGIVSALNELEVDIGRLSQFAETTSNGHSRRAPAAPQAASSNLYVNTQKDKGAALDATPAQLATKLTWATKIGGEAKKAEVKSLLRIQKEELSSKD